MTDTTALIPLHDPAQPAVTLVTALSQAGDLSDFEYRQIYDHVAAGRSLRNIELALQSAVSYGWWSKYASGEKVLDRERKNELRRWARANGGPDLPALPPTPGEIVAAHVHPDAAVYRIGAAIASRVVLIGADVPAVNLRLNGNCTAALPVTPRVTAVTAPSRRRSTQSLAVRRETWQRLNSRRLALGLTWDELLGRLLE